MEKEIVIDNLSLSFLKGGKGDTGEAGKNGMSAYEIAVQNGFKGTVEEWLISLKGDDGEISMPIAYDGTFAQLKESEMNHSFNYIIMDDSDEEYKGHWTYYDKKENQWKDGGEYLAYKLSNEAKDTVKQKMYYFKNIEDMKNCLTLVNGDVIKTLGYYQENDGGAGTYQIVNDNTVIDNTEMIHIIKNGLMARLIVEDKVNIKQLGAKGDGVTNDTETIKNAIKNYNSLYFPNGTYIINETIRIEKDISLLGESTNVILNTSNDTAIVMDVSKCTNLEMCNFKTTNSKIKVYPDQEEGKRLPQIMKDKKFFIQNVVSDGKSMTNWNLFICTPKPDNYERDFHTGLYSRYPIEIYNHSGYNAINIENIMENDDGTTATVSDNSAIGIVDKCKSSSPAIFVDMHAERNVMNIKNRTDSTTANSTSNPDSVFQLGWNGHVAIGCSVYNEEGASGVGTMKLKDNAPSIRFYDINNNSIQAIRSQNKQFQFLANGAIAGYFDERQNLHLNKSFVTALEHTGSIVFTSSYANGSDYHVFIDDKGILRINRVATGNIQNSNVGYAVITNRNGTSNQRPTSQLTNDWQSIGFQFFDTTINKPIWWTGTEWTELTYDDTELKTRMTTIENTVGNISTILDQVNGEVV